MNDITRPLQLARGSHRAGSGTGCAMNVISWENGDTTITDFPDCTDELLAIVVQSVNDHICHHTPLVGGDIMEDEFGKVGFYITASDGKWHPVSELPPRRLCPECSATVLDLAHRTVGTNVFATPEGAPSGLSRPSAYLRLASLLHESGVRVDFRDYDNAKTLARNIAMGIRLADPPGRRLQAAHRLISAFYRITGLTENPQPVAPEVTQAALDKMLVKS